MVFPQPCMLCVHMVLSMMNFKSPCDSKFLAFQSINGLFFDAYSSLGLTKVLYAASFVPLGAKAKFLRRKRSVLVALKEISERC